MLDFDTMLLHVGEFGLYQKILFTFQAPFCIFVTFVLFGQVFMVLYPQNYWCGDHFACLDIDSEVNAAQRRNISLRWLEPGLFQDACETNFVDENFLRQLDSLEERACNTRNASADCNLELNEPRFWTTRGQSSSHNPRRTTRRPYQPDVGPPPRIILEEPGNETVISRRKRQYSRQPWGYPSRFPGRTTTTTEKSYVFGDDKWGQGEGSQGEYGNNGNGYSTSGSNSGKERYDSDSGYPTTSRPRGSGGRNNNNDRYGSRPRSTTTQRTTTPFRDYVYDGEFNDRTTDRTPSSSPSRRPSKESERELAKQRLKQIKAIEKFRDFQPSRLLETPANSAFAGWKWSECKGNRFKLNFRDRTFFWAQNMKRQFPNNGSYGRFEHCNPRWNRTELPYQTIVTEGNWWCNAEAYITISQAVFFLGAIVGGFLIGWIADTFGRVPALVIANILGAVGGALSAVSTNIWVFSIFRFITGMSFDNSMTMMYILVLEFCGPSYRTLVANLSIAIFYTFGTIMLPLLAYYIADWRTYALVISLPMLLALLALFFVPESARWLLSKGRAKEATNILRNFAKVNRRKVDDHVFVDFEQEATKLFAELQNEEEEPSLTAAFRTPRLRRTFMLLIIFWSLIALVYDGHSRNIINLANEELNVFWMFGIASMTEFPADMLLIFTLDRFGRRWLAFGAMTLSGAFSIIAAAITPEMRIGFLVTAIISRFWVNVAFNIGLQYAAELLPTVIRAQGVNAIHIMGYVASIISPFVAAIGRSNPTLSLILLGAFAITAGVAALFLAETLGEELPNTLEEAEAFGKNQSFWNCPICAKDYDDEDEPIQVEPEPSYRSSEERSVMLRNALRGSIRGETYRSSMLSQASSGSGGLAYKRSQRLRSGRNRVHQAPEPTEMTKLRRITH